MNEKTRKWMDDLTKTPDYEAAGLALNLIGECEKRRDELGWSYAELARQMGVSRQRVNQIMTGTCNMTLLSVVKPTRVMGVKVEVKLIGGTE